MTNRELAVTHRASGPVRERDVDAPDSTSWIAQGVAAGLAGAFLVAVFFLFVDYQERAMLWTPTALGSALFLGEQIASDAQVRPALVFAYTAVHGTVFIGTALAAAFGLASRGRRPGLPTLLGVMATLFAVYQASFLAFAAVFAPQLLPVFGFGTVALANLLAAGATTILLLVLRGLDGDDLR